MRSMRSSLRVLLALAVALTVLPALAAPRMTGFDPRQHGFLFANTFSNDVVRELDIRTDGLCGGMVYTALDHFNARVPISRQTHRPAVNTALHDYIYKRQVNSLADNADKWAEVGFNPFGARNSEFFNWGLQGFNGGRLQELRAKIDRGQPVPLGLWHYDGQRGGDHQVLAIGYDTGRYAGDLGRHREELKIFIYDPNYPGETKVLVPDLQRGGYLYPGDDKLWLTYFVDGKYRPNPPPASVTASAGVVVTPPAGRVVAPARVVTATRPATNVPVRGGAAGPTTRQLLLTIHTGGDDLRGGNDNVDATIHIRGQAPVHQRNLNGSRRWIGDYDQTVSIRLPRAVPLADLQALTLSTHFGGGIGGDNWNVDAVRVVALTSDGERELLSARGAPLVRFTGQVHDYRADLSP